MTISKKLYFSFAAALAFTLVLGTAAWTSLAHIGSQIKISSSSTHKLALAGEVDTLTGNMLSAQRGIVIRTLLKDPQKIEQYNSEFREEAGKRQALLKEYLAVTTSQQARAILQEIYDTYGVTLHDHEALYRLAKAGDGVGAAGLQSGTIMPLATNTELRVQTLKQIASEQVKDIGINNESTVASSAWLVAVMLVLSIAVGAVVIYIVRGINDALTQTVIELTESADQIASASNQVSSSSQSLAQGASEQAASLEETSASSAEINSMAYKNTENAVGMSKSVNDSKSEFTKTNMQLGEMMTAMDEINQSSGKIAKIIKIIDEIAFQTNILALNAAVEAARAGEAGMGFAVVADEVRSLAQRSAQAAKDTAALIEDSVSKSEAGKSKLGGVASSIQRISHEFTSLATLVEEVSHGSREQSTGIDQIGKALAQMEQVTQTTAANAEESAAAAEELNAQSESMKELTGRLKEMVGAKVGTSFTQTRQTNASRRSAHSGVKEAPTVLRQFGSKLSTVKPTPATYSHNASSFEDSFSSF